MENWFDISRSEKFQELSQEEQVAVKQRFFERFMLPKMEEDEDLKNPEVKQAVFQKFMSSPNDTGQGYVTSMLGAAGRGFGEVVPGAIEGVGALTGIEPLREGGQAIREGLESISPVNPIYEEGVMPKIMQTAGNVGSILATAGIGGAIGKGLAAERIAAAGTTAAEQAIARKAIETGAKSALYSTGFAQGAAEKSQENERLGISGPEAYMNLVGGGLSEIVPEMLPFGTALETAAARRVLGGVDEAGKVIPGIRLSAAQEAAEGGATKVLSNISTQMAVPAGTEAPGLFEGVGEAALWEGVGGGMFGAINKLGRTPAAKQTDVQKSISSKAGGVPVDTVPEQTEEEKLKAAEAGGTTVVAPDGKTAVIAPEEPSMPDPAEVAKTIGKTSVEKLTAIGDEVSAAAQTDFNVVAAEALGEKPEPTIQPEQAAEEVEAEVMPSPEGASMPMMVTRDMKQQLVDLGYSKTDINAMRPEEAAAIIKSGVSKNAVPPTEQVYEPNIQETLQQEQGGGPILPQPRELPVLPEQPSAQAPEARAAFGEGRIQPQTIEPQDNAIQGARGIPVVMGSPGYRITDKRKTEEYQKQGGWKLHLAVSPENYKAVDEWLAKNHKGTYKLLTGGDVGESDFTIYVGDKDSAADLAQNIESEIGSLLLNREAGTDQFFTNKVTGRFDVQRTGKAKDVPWVLYGAQGIPFDQEAAETIAGIRNREDWLKAAQPELSRIDRELSQKYGTRYTGTKTKQQPVETQENAPRPIQIEESLPEEPQDRVESREAEGSISRDQLRSPAEGEEEVVDPEMQELQELTLRRGQVQNKVKGVRFTKKDESRFKELSEKLQPQLRETVDPQNDPIVGEDINDQPIRQSSQGTYYTFENGRVRTGPSFKGEPITLLGEPTTATEGMVTPGGVATERETDEQRFQRIKALKPSQRSDDDIAFANAFSKRQKELKPQAGETTRKAFISSHTASIGGRLRKALDQSMNFRGLKGTVGSWVEALYNEGWRMALDARGNRQFTNGTEALGSSGLGKVGMNYADFLSSQPQTTAAETQTPESVVGPQKKNDVQGTVTKADVETAREALTNSGEIPNAYLTNVYESREAFLADRMNARLFPASYARLQTEKNIEGLFENGQALVFAKEVHVSDLDRGLAKMLGISDEQVAARRVIAHENGHKAISLFTMAEKRELRGYLMRAYSDEQVENHVKTYTEYADWRTNPESRFEALEELLLRDFEKMEKIPTGGVWDDIVQFLKRVWRRLTGQKGEPTLKELKDVVRLMRNAMKRSEVPMGSYTLKDGGGVKLSYAGEKAIENLPEERHQFMRDSLDAAKAMAAAGKDSEEIRAVTGWFPGKYDGKMRWEVPDEGAVLNESPEITKLRKEAEKATAIFEEVKARGEGFSPAFNEAQVHMFNAQNKLRRADGEGDLTTVGERLVHSKLFAAYPAAKNIRLVMEAMQPNYGGYFDPIANRIAINSSHSKEAQLSSLLHEIQHWIQKQENFATGGDLSQFLYGDDFKLSGEDQKAVDDIDAQIAELRKEERDLGEFFRNLPDAMKGVGKTVKESRRLESISYEIRSLNDKRYAIVKPARNRMAMDKYRRTAGEIEARDVQARQKLTPEQRAATAPYSSENIAPEDAIVLFGSGPQASVQYSSDYTAAKSAGEEAARSTLYSERDMDIREAIRRAYESMPKPNSVAVPIGELFSKTKELVPNVSEDEFSNVLQDLFEDNGAVLQEGEVVEPVTKQDAEYLAAVEAGDMEKAQRMVDEADAARLTSAQNERAKILKNLSPESSKDTVDGAVERDSAVRALLDTFTVPIGFTLEGAGASGGGSIYIMARDVIERNADGEPLEVEDFKLSIRNHDPSPFREKEFGKVDKYEEVEDPRNPIEVAAAITKLEQWLDKKGYQNDSVTRDDSGNVIPLSRRFDTGLDIRGQINVTTKEGQRAGFVVVMPRAAKASRIKAEDVQSASKQFQDDVIEAGKGRMDTADYQGNRLKSVEAPDHNVNAPELYLNAAVNLVDSLLAQGHSIQDIAESIQDPDFKMEIGLLGNKAITSNMSQQADLFLGAEIQNRLQNAIRKERNPAKKRALEKTLKTHKLYYTTATGIGQNLNAVNELQQNPRFKWMFLFDKTEAEMAEKAKEKLDAITGGTQGITDTVNKVDEESADAATQEMEDDIQEDADAALLREGEEALDTDRRKIWDRIKDILRKLALIARAKMRRSANAAKASISKAESDAIFKMSDDELAKLEKELLGEFDKLAKAFLGEDSESKTPEQKKTRAKRKQMVDTAKKRAEAGKDVEVTKIQIQSFMDELMPGYTERESIVNEVGDAILKAAEQRKAKPKQRTAIQDLVSAIKQTLMANLKGDKVNAEQPSLGMLLAKTFAQQGSEPEVFAKSWEDGRKKVRAMLSEMGVEEENLDAELDAIMPPTPTLAYAPAAARKAVSNAMREAGLMRSDLINDPVGSKKAIMDKFDEAAKSANLTEEGWDKKGRALAEKAIDESITEAKTAQERAKKVAKILSEQADNPVSLEEFGAKLAEFRFKKDKISDLFNRAKKLAEKKIQIANDQAIRVLLAAENKLAQSAFFNAAEKPDTIVKAFREQVEEPMGRDAFKKRMEKMLVTPEMADKLFDKAARERDNARWKKAQDILEGTNALKNLLRELNKARPGEQIPFSKQIPWREILSQKAKTVAEYRQRIFDAVSANEAFQNLSDEQKNRLSDLFAEAWEAKRKAILDSMLQREINEKLRKNEITKAAADALQKSRNKIIELVNLGGFDNDDLMKILGEKFDISTSFTEEQKARISELADKLQDEDLNPAKRNKLATEFLTTLAGASEVPVTEILSNWWTASVLFGPQTIFSIGAAFMNGAYNILTVGATRTLGKLTHLDVQGAIQESIATLQGIIRYLEAFPQSIKRAWHYLWSGDVDLLGASANDILGEIKSLEDLKKFNRHKMLAENLAKDPRAMRRYVGVYLRFINRLLTALDAFNVMVTKAGSVSLALRQAGMNPDAITKAEKMLDLEPYKKAIIAEEFGDKAPTTSADKARLHSYAEAAMNKSLNELGAKMENADYLASESAFTMTPTGAGGFIFNKITSIDQALRKSADEFLKNSQKDWSSQKDFLNLRNLALAYISHFLAYQAANAAGTKFIRYASNKFNQGISYLPLIGLARKWEERNDAIKGKDAFIDTIHRNQAVGVVMTLIGIMVVNALEDEPDDEERGWFWNGGWNNLSPDRKKQLLAKGQKEYTMGFKVNGRWYVFNYQNWPWNQVAAAIGSMSDMIRYSPEQWDEKQMLGKIASGMVSGASSALDVPALSQLGELFNNRVASKDPTEQSIDRFSRIASGWAGGFVPRILKDLDFYTQPELRKYQGLWEKTASHIPIYRRYVGDEYYDILGQPIKRNVIPGSREFMAGPTEPEYKILGALNSRNIWLTPANAEYRMVGKGRNRRRLTQDEADAYSLETGKGYRQMLLRYGQRALQMPTERARAFLQDKADEVRDRALKKVYRR